MRSWRAGRAVLAFGVLAAGSALVATAQSSQDVLPLGPARERGASVTPAFEGWYQNDDGSFTLLVGYYNRNAKQPLDIPIGPNNKIEPGEPDQGQPTHFEVGRQWGVFTLKVPKDFGKKTVTWTLVSNGEAQAIPFTLHPGYPITPFKELGMGNEPPVLAFSQGGKKVTGPPVSVAATLTAKINQPLSIDVWVEDAKAPGQEEEGSRRGAAAVATVSFHNYRGAGEVSFDPARIPASKQGEKVTTKATFAAAGDYLVRVQANDESGEGGFGFQCCWTNTFLKVTVQ